MPAPSEHNLTPITSSAGAASAAIPVPGSGDREISFGGTNAFDINFGDANVSAPPGTVGAPISGRIVHTFLVGARDTHVRVGSTVAITVRMWRGARPTMKAPRDAVSLAVDAVSTGPFPTGVGAASDRAITFSANRNFDILFSDDGTSNIPDVTNTQMFLAGIPYTFEIGPKNTHFKIIAASAGGLIKHWVSSRT